MSASTTPTGWPVAERDDLDRSLSDFDRLRAAHPARTVKRFPYVWLDDAKVSFENTDLVKGLLPSAGLVLVYGPSGDGKTFWTIDLCCHVAEGREWRSKRVRRSLVVYVAAEAGTSIVRRFVARRSDPKAGERTPLAIVTRGANLLDIRDVDALVSELKDLSIEAGMPIGMVVFDTFSRSMPGGDENGPQDVTQVIAAADRLRDVFQATTLFVHHSGKDEARGARGWNGLYAAADAVINVLDKVGTVKKSRDGAGDEQFPFTLKVIDLGEDADGDMLTTCIVEQADSGTAPAKRKPLPAQANTAFQALREVLQDKGIRIPETSSIPRNTTVVTLSLWSDQFKLRYGSDNINAFNQAFKRAKERLLAEGLIGISDPNVWIV